MLYTRKEVRAMLPKVGDIRMEKPTEAKAPGLQAAPMECRVIEVNRAHMWYRVRFTASGFTECYKLPAVTWQPFGGATR
jgi:hypothetical protein